jgi:hypothetical protein
VASKAGSVAKKLCHLNLSTNGWKKSNWANVRGKKLVARQERALAACFCLMAACRPEGAAWRRNYTKICK